MMVFFSAGVGIWLSTFAVRFRDVKVGLPFVIRMLMYTAPVVYPMSSIPESYRFLYSLNPITSVVEGFRYCLIGIPFNWSVLWPGFAVTVLILISGIFYFRRFEPIFVDVV
jgi:lipopolysaccharide transport system permease protein